jgi:hypothetical protein
MSSAYLQRPPSVLPDISPSKGEISRPHGFRQSPASARKATALQLPISPLEGEMSGRTEGGRDKRPADAAAGAMA